MTSWRWGIDSYVNKEALKRINASHDNLIDVEDPRMDEGKLENNILFGHFKFEISETIPCSTISENRTLNQKNYNKYLKRFLGQMLIDDICGSGLESMEHKFHDMNLAVISDTWHQKNRQQKKKMVNWTMSKFKTRCPSADEWISNYIINKGEWRVKWGKTYSFFGWAKWWPQYSVIMCIMDI